MRVLFAAAIAAVSLVATQSSAAVTISASGTLSDLGYSGALGSDMASEFQVSIPSTWSFTASFESVADPIYADPVYHLVDYSLTISGRTFDGSNSIERGRISFGGTGSLIELGGEGDFFAATPGTDWFTSTLSLGNLNYDFSVDDLLAENREFSFVFVNFDSGTSTYGFSSLDASLTSASITGSFDAPVTNPDPIPEPTTWALMILGFGAVGGAVRRRRSVPAGL